MSEAKPKNRRSYAPEFKLQLVVQIVSGVKSIAQLSREHRIKDSLLSRWRDEFLEAAPALFGRQRTVSDDERIAELERLVGRQHLEIEILKKASRRLL